MEADLLNELELLSVEELEKRLSGHLNAADAYMNEARAIASKSAIEVFRGGRVAFVLRERLKREKAWEKWLRDNPHYKRSTVNRAIRLYEAVTAIEGDEAEQALGNSPPVEAYNHYLSEFKKSPKKAMSQNGTSGAASNSSQSDDQSSKPKPDQPVADNAQSGNEQVGGDQDGDDADTGRSRDAEINGDGVEAEEGQESADNGGTTAPLKRPPVGHGGFGPFVPDHLPEGIRFAREALQNPETEREAQCIARTISQALLLEAVSMLGWKHTFELLTALRNEASTDVEPEGSSG